MDFCSLFLLLSQFMFVSILLVGSDDGNEELLAAANAVINPGIFLTCFVYSSAYMIE